MRITYICHARFPSEKAYAHQISQVCAALAENGHEVELLCPKNEDALSGSPQALYRIKTDFRVSPLPNFNALKSRLVPGLLAVHVTWASYRRSLTKHFLADKPDLVIARSAAVLGPALDAGIPAVLELHTVPGPLQPNFVRTAKRCRLIVALTTPMRDALIRRGIPAEKIVVEPDGVDLEAFANLPAKPAAKAAWSLPTDRPVVAYVGSLKSGHDLPKGVEELIGAAAFVQQKQPFLLWIVGGPMSEVGRLQSLLIATGLTPNVVRFEGPVPSAKVPSAIAAADLCVYPAPKSTDPFFTRDTSPLKLLEYMASGVPTVTANLPPIHDLLDESTTRFCAPGSATDLARAISEALADPHGSAKRAATAKERVTRFSWHERMARITQFCIA